MRNDGGDGIKTIECIYEMSWNTGENSKLDSPFAPIQASDSTEKKSDNVFQVSLSVNMDK